MARVRPYFQSGNISLYTVTISPSKGIISASHCYWFVNQFTEFSSSVRSLRRSKTFDKVVAFTCAESHPDSCSYKFANSSARARQRSEFILLLWKQLIFAFMSRGVNTADSCLPLRIGSSGSLGEKGAISSTHRVETLNFCCLLLT